ncbi:hypothetical protein ACP70R_030982 [Stipagrostis hirtigluma subsp. patula]
MDPGRWKKSCSVAPRRWFLPCPPRPFPFAPGRERIHTSGVVELFHATPRRGLEGGGES